jgi:signal transduction histidine kinase
MKELDSLFKASARKIVNYSAVVSLLAFFIAGVINFNRYNNQKILISKHIKIMLSYNRITPIEEGQFLKSLSKSTENFSYVLSNKNNSRVLGDYFCSRNNCYSFDYSKLFHKSLQPTYLIFILILVLSTTITLIQVKFKKLINSEISTFKKLVSSGLDSNIKVNTKELYALVEILRDRKVTDRSLFMNREIAHDMKAPITALRSIIDSPNQDSVLLRGVLDRLLNLNNKILSNEYNEKTIPHNLYELIEKSVREIKIKFNKAEISIEANQIVRESMVRLKPTDFHRAVINILKNSIEALGTHKPIVSIKLDISNEDLLVIFQDNGPGFPSAIFKDFGHKPLSINKENGNGIGLLQVHRAILTSHGKVSLSNNKQGAVTKISFNLNPIFILIEDDHLIQLAWEISAKEAGYTLKSYSNVEDFIFESSEFKKDTIVYIDSNLGNGIRGEIEAEKIYNLGFDNIILATGYESTSIDKPDYIKEIVGKDVPF